MPELTITLSTEEHEQLVAYAAAFRHSPEQQVEVFVLAGLKIEMKAPPKVTKTEKDGKADKDAKVPKASPTNGPVPTTSGASL